MMAYWVWCTGKQAGSPCPSRATQDDGLCDRHRADKDKEGRRT